MNSFREIANQSVLRLNPIRRRIADVAMPSDVEECMELTFVLSF